MAYVASDRSDIAFACKKCSRTVGKATCADLARLKRIGQDETKAVTVNGYAAGRAKTRRSGGCLRVGQHIVVTRSSTRKVVSLSSGESEYYNVVRCVREIIGLASTIRELGHEAHVRVWTGAAAARVRAATKYFWLQQKEENKELRIEKIRSTVKIPLIW